jgi:hypothetical protein
VPKGRGRPRPFFFKTLLATADNPLVTMTISPPIRVFAAVGVIAAMGLALFLFVLGRAGDTGRETASTVAPKTPPATAETPARQTPVKPQQPTATRFQTPRSGFPSAVDRAFRKHRVVVLVVFMPGSPVDALVRAEARAAAIATRAGYVRINALNERLAGQLLAKTGVLPDPAVLVLRRPGLVTATLGVTDRTTVVQAVAEAKR